MGDFPATTVEQWSVNKTLEFIDDYAKYPELWDIRCSEYKNNKKKFDALQELQKKYGGSIEDLKKKIKNLRTAYLRERKKLKSGSSPSRKPKWYCFDALSFLGDLHLPRTTLYPDTENLGEQLSQAEEEENMEFLNESSVMCETIITSPPMPSTSGVTPSPRVSKKRKMDTSREDFAFSVLQDAVANRSPFQPFGDMIAKELEELRPSLRPIVKKKIFDIFYQAQMGEFDEKLSVGVQTEGEILDVDLVQP